MATMNFSVPGDVRAAFNEMFAGTNTSAVLAELMRQAVEERRRPEAESACHLAPARVARTPQVMAQISGVNPVALAPRL